MDWNKAADVMLNHAFNLRLSSIPCATCPNAAVSGNYYCPSCLRAIADLCRQEANRLAIAKEIDDIVDRREASRTQEPAAREKGGTSEEP